jgi:hypothetical protein
MRPLARIRGAVGRPPPRLALAFVASCAAFSAAQVALLWLHPPPDAAVGGSSEKAKAKASATSLSASVAALFGYRHNRRDDRREIYRDRRRQRRGREKEEDPQPQRRPRSPTLLLSPSGTGPSYHVVFSTSCGRQQDWESLAFFYHAAKVGQRGNVVRPCFSFS